MARSASMLLAVSLIAASLPSSAQADWQYTRWGMTPKQVIAASQGQVAFRPVKAPKPGGPTEEVGGSYQTEDRTYDVHFTFSGDRLTMVTLKAEPCGSVITDLKTVYGEPVDQAGGMFPRMTWADKRAKNEVTAFQIFSECLVMYAPLKSKGL